MTSYSWTTSVFIKLLESKKPSKRAVQFSFTSRHTVPTSIPSSNYSPHSRRSSAELPHILSRMRHSPSGAFARPSPRVSLKSLELNALHTSRTQDMVHLNGNRSSATLEANVDTCPQGVAQGVAIARQGAAAAGAARSAPRARAGWTTEQVNALAVLRLGPSCRRRPRTCSARPAPSPAPPTSPAAAPAVAPIRIRQKAKRNRRPSVDAAAAAAAGRAGPRARAGATEQGKEAPFAGF